MWLEFVIGLLLVLTLSDGALGKRLLSLLSYSEPLTVLRGYPIGQVAGLKRALRVQIPVWALF